MLRKLRSRMTYANVVSTIALGLAIGGGTAYAATKIGTSNIRYHAVTGSKVSTNAVTASKIKASSLSGSDIRNNSVTGADIRNGDAPGVRLRRRPAAQGRQGRQGRSRHVDLRRRDRRGRAGDAQERHGDLPHRHRPYTVTAAQDVSQCAGVATAHRRHGRHGERAAHARQRRAVHVLNTFGQDGDANQRAFQFAMYC